MLPVKRIEKTCLASILDKMLSNVKWQTSQGWQHLKIPTVWQTQPIHDIYILLLIHYINIFKDTIQKLNYHI